MDFKLGCVVDIIAALSWRDMQCLAELISAELNGRTDAGAVAEAITVVAERLKCDVDGEASARWAAAARAGAK